MFNNSLDFINNSRKEPLWSEYRELNGFFWPNESSIDLIDNKTEYTLIAPGLNKEDFKITLLNDKLTVCYDVLTKNFKSLLKKKHSESLVLTNIADCNNIVATYEQGILKITIPHLYNAKNTEQKIIVVK